MEYQKFHFVQETRLTFIVAYNNFADLSSLLRELKFSQKHVENACSIFGNTMFYKLFILGS